MFDFSNLLQGITSGAVPALSGGLQAQKVNPVSYAQPPASSMGPLMQQAYGMAGPAPQNQPPPQMGVPNHPGLPGGPPPILHPQTPQIPMRDPMQILQMLRQGGFNGGGMLR